MNNYNNCHVNSSYCPDKENQMGQKNINRIPNEERYSERSIAFFFAVDFLEYTPHLCWTRWTLPTGICTANELDKDARIFIVDYFIFVLTRFEQQS